MNDMHNGESSALSLNSKESRLSSWVLYTSMFIMGGCGLAYEYTLSKLSSDLLGSSVKQWAIVIGVMMFFMGIGSDVQKYLKNSNLFSAFISTEILLSLCGAFAPIIILFTYGTFPSHFVLVLYFFIAIIGLLIGFEIPLLTRINEKYTKELRFNVGGILKMDYVGALGGALLWVFVLPKFFTIVEMAFVLGLLSGFAALFAFIYFYKVIEKKLPLFIFCICSLGVIFFGLFSAKDLTSYAEQFLYRDRVVFAESSPYQHIVITKSPSSNISLFINGHLQFNSADEYIYHETLVHPAMSASHKREKVLVLGGGDGMAVREILKYPDVKSVVLCDLDPVITDLARENSYLVDINKGSLLNSQVSIIKNQAIQGNSSKPLYIQNQNSRFRKEVFERGQVKVINIDAVKFVEQIGDRFDVIILDFPDPNAPELAKLYSKRFYSLLRKRLSPGGIIAGQSTSAYFTKEAFLSIGRTIEASGFVGLPYHETVPSFGEWGFWIFADKKWYSKDKLRERLKIDKLMVPTRHLDPEVLNAAFIFGKGQLSSKHNDINTISSSRIYEYYVEGWEQFF